MLDKHRIATLLTVFTVFLLLIVHAPTVVGQAEPEFVVIPAPSNDDFANAETLVLNKRFKTGGWLGAADLEPAETTDPDLTSCYMYASVWYRFTAPFSGALALSTAGSMINKIYWQTTDTKIAVYTGSTLANLVQVACSDDSSELYGEVEDLAITAGTMYYVRVGAFTSETIVGGWYKTIAVVKDAYGDPVGLQNGEFNSDLSGNWTLVRNFNGDMRVCAGDCEFKFVGGLDESTKLQQVRLWPTAVLLVRPEHSMRLSWSIRTSAAPLMKIQLLLVYSDGTPSTKSYFFMTAEQATDTYMSLTAIFESPNIRKVKASFTNKATSGTAYIDSVALDYGGGLLRDGALPIPLPPQ